MLLLQQGFMGRRVDGNFSSNYLQREVCHDHGSTGLMKSRKKHPWGRRIRSFLAFFGAETEHYFFVNIDGQADIRIVKKKTFILCYP